MGNSASSIPFSIDKQVGTPHDNHGWALHEGKSTTDESPVSVFVGKKPLLAKTPVSPRFAHQMQLQPAFHHYQNCRKLRHPQILKVFATLDTDNPKAATTDGSTSASSESSTPSAVTGDLIVVTEPCIPLTQWLLTNPRPAELAWGLECIVRGVHFIHSSAQMAHGNMHPSSFYVTPAGDVKVWNFSLVTAIGANLGPTPYFQEWEAAVCPDTYRSQERLEKRWEIISLAGTHAMDSFGLGILTDHFFGGNIPGPLQKAVQRLQTGNIKMRPRLQPLLKCPVFDTPLQKVHLQLEEMAVQPVEQKISLWQSLNNQLQNGAFPDGLAIHKMLPILNRSIKTICSNDAMLSQDLYRREVLAMVPPLFYIVETFLDSEGIKKVLSPLIGMLFVVKDRGVRGALLAKVSFMAENLDKNALNISIFEPLCSGFSDSSSALRELTLKATAELVPHLNQPNLDKLSRYLVRLQGDSETSIRTNAIIFIGRLASSLTDTSRDKMLLPAFARAFKDPFIPCRKAALQAIIKTKEFYSMASLANRVLPAIMPMLLDPVTEIRNDAFQVVDIFMGLLRQESMRMATMAQQQAQKQQQERMNGQAPISGGAQPIQAAASAEPLASAPSSGGYLSGISSWMTSSAAAPAATPGNLGTPQQTAPTIAPAPATAPAAGIAQTQQQFASMNMNTSTSLSATNVGEEDGWGDEEDHWDDNDNSNLTAANPSGTAATSYASQSFASPTPAASYGFSSPAEDDDPFASIGVTNTMKTRVVAPRSRLVVPKKKALPAVQKMTPPATKLSIEDDDVEDGWDDF